MPGLRRIENERLLKQAANSRYFQRHREALNEKRRNRRRKKQKLARHEKLAAEVRAAVKRTAAPAAAGIRRER